MTGLKILKERETEKTRGKKRFLERQQEDLEAEQEIKEFKYEDSADERGADRQDGVRPERS